LATIRNAVLAASAGGCVALGLFGWAQQTDFQSGRTLSYLAAASFWIYLIHHPIVGLAHVTLSTSLGDSLSAPSKCLLAFTAGVTVSLLSFELLGRRAPLARLLALPHALRKASPQDDSSPANEDAQYRTDVTKQPAAHRAA
jgi:peptidoglycan/LPS O-acetylase OafA/YrhL